MTAEQTAPATTPDPSLARSPQSGLPPFFAVSLRKLAIMSICTMGMYHLYWWYAQWRQVRVWHVGRDFSPARRTLMLAFFCYPVFRKVREQDQQLNGRSRLQAGLLTLGYIAANLLDVLPGLWSLLSIFSFVFLLPVQARANEVNEQRCAHFHRNDSLSAWNWVVLVLGVLLLVLSVLAAIDEMGK